MIDPNLEAYLKRAKQSGMQTGEIKAILLNAGWKQNQFEDAIKSVFPSETPQNYATSNFEKMRRLLLIIIGLRVALFPIRYFLAPLQLTPNAFARYASLPFLGNVGILGAVLPLFWIFPLLGIWLRQKSSYFISIVFGALLIYVNIFTLANIVATNLFIILTAVYLITGLSIIFLSFKSLKYFTKKEESPSRPVQIKNSLLIIVQGATSLVFAITVITPGLLFGLNGASQKSIALLLALVVAVTTGWNCSKGIIADIRIGRHSAEKGILYGAINGAIAQLPLYGFSQMQSLAMPIGAFIGSILGFIGVLVISGVIYLVIVKRA